MAYELRHVHRSSLGPQQHACDAPLFSLISGEREIPGVTVIMLPTTLMVGNVDCDRSDVDKNLIPLRFPLCLREKDRTVIVCTSAHGEVSECNSCPGASERDVRMTMPSAKKCTWNIASRETPSSCQCQLHTASWLSAYSATVVGLPSSRRTSSCANPRTTFAMFSAVNTCVTETR